MESLAGRTSMDQLAWSVKHALNGHLPYERHAMACMRKQSQRWPQESMERHMCEALHLDINPLVQVASLINSPVRFGRAFNVYNQNPRLGGQTFIDRMADNGWEISRNTAPQFAHMDLTLARDCTLTCAEILMSSVKANFAQKPIHAIAPNVTTLMDRLALTDSAVFDAAVIFETESEAKVSELSRHLGCSERTINRIFRACGFRATELRQAIMLIKATRMLALPGSMTEIAHACGFFDLAHFTRAFKRAVGVSPSAMRRASFDL